MSDIQGITSAYLSTVMTPREKRRLALIDRVKALTHESYSLPRSPDSFARWEEIDGELLRLFREIAALSVSAESRPYWFDESGEEDV